MLPLSNLHLQDSLQILFQLIHFQIGIFSIITGFRNWNLNMAICTHMLLVLLKQMIIFPTKWITWIKRWWVYFFINYTLHFNISFMYYNTYILHRLQLKGIFNPNWLKIFKGTLLLVLLKQIIIFLTKWIKRWWVYFFINYALHYNINVLTWYIRVVGFRSILGNFIRWFRWVQESF